MRFFLCNLEGVAFFLPHTAIFVYLSGEFRSLFGGRKRLCVAEVINGDGKKNVQEGVCQTESRNLTNTTAIC